MRYSAILALTLALAGCGGEAPAPAPSGPTPATTEVAADNSAAQPAILATSDPAYAGEWVPVDRSNAGFTLYVDRSSIVPISAARKRADMGYADYSGRTLVRIVFHCDEKMADRIDDGLGHVETDLPDLVGDLPRDEPHLSARDYVCFGRRSKPERDMPVIKEIPSVATSAATND